MIALLAACGRPRPRAGRRAWSHPRRPAHATRRRRLAGERRHNTDGVRNRRPVTIPHGGSRAAGDGATLADYTADPFFDPGDTPPGAPGTMIRSRPVPVSVDGAQAWQVLHWSRTAEDRPVAVSATVVAPTAATANPRAVLASAHQPTGMGDRVLDLRRRGRAGAGPNDRSTTAVDQGLTVLPDYQGLGTPGDHAYLVGQAEGRNVLDGIRAATRLDGSGASPDSKTVVWGHSQGQRGGVRRRAAAHVRAGRAPSSARSAARRHRPHRGRPRAATDPAYRGFLPHGRRGPSSRLPGAGGGRPPAHRRRPPGLGPGRRRVPGRHADHLPRRGPGTAPGRAAHRPAPLATGPGRGNRAGDRPTPVPIFLYHGGADDLVPPQLSAELLARYCELGVTASRTVYPDTDHVSVIAAAYADVGAYLQARLAGEPAPSSC